MRSPHARQFVGTSLLVVLALMSSACGGSSSADVVTQAGSASTNDDGRPSSFDDIEFNSPISDFLGFDFSNSDENEARFAEMERESNRLVTQCMLDKGFEYESSSSTIVSFENDDGLPYFSAEWVEKFGFGITTMEFAQSAVGPDLVGYDDSAFDRSGPPGSDNQEYLDGLTPGERQAYDEALFGLPVDFDDQDSESGEFGFEPSGCFGEGFEAFDQDGVFAFFDAFQGELESLEDRAESDSRVIEYRRRVSECVADAGFSYIDEETLRDDFQSRLSTVRPGFTANPFENADVDPEEMSERELEEFFRDLDRISPDKLPILAELQAEELELAQVVIGCDGGPLNEEYFLGAVRQEFEQEFLDNNAEALAEFKGE